MSVTKVTDDLRDTTALDGTKVSGTIPVGSLFASGGKGADIASAATVVIGTDGSYFDITGTTGISTQFTVAAGRRFTLQFDGAVTITDNAAITLSGAANFTTAAGDILSFVATAANTVVQTGYSLVDGGSPAGGGGKINQVIIASNSTLLDLSSDTYTDSGLTASITPSATDSRILIQYEMQGTGNGVNHGFGTQIARDIASGGYSTLSGSDHGTLYDISTGASTNYRLRGAYNFMDTTHGSTGAVSYKIQVACYGSRRIEFTETGGGASGASTYIILWEILA